MMARESRESNKVVNEKVETNISAEVVWMEDDMQTFPLIQVYLGSGFNLYEKNIRKNGIFP